MLDIQCADDNAIDLNLILDLECDRVLGLVLNTKKLHLSVIFPEENPYAEIDEGYRVPVMSMNFF